MLIYGGEATTGTTAEMFALTFAETTQEDIDTAQQEYDSFEPTEQETEFQAGERQKTLRRKLEDIVYRSKSHWQKQVPKCFEDVVGGQEPKNPGPRLSGHYAVMYNVPRHNPHRPEPGHVMLVFGGFCDNFLLPEIWELDMPHQKVPVWRRLGTVDHIVGEDGLKRQSTPPVNCNHFAGCSIDFNNDGMAEYAPGEDPKLLWGPNHNILVTTGKLGPGDNKLTVTNFDLKSRCWQRARLAWGPSSGSMGKFVLAANGDKKQWVYLCAHEDACFPLEIHLREEVQQDQRNTRYPGFFGESQAGGMFKLQIPTELEQRERFRARTRALTVAKPSDREAKALAKAKLAIENKRSLRKAEFRRTMNPAPRPENVTSCPPLDIRRFESMPQYFTFTNIFRP